ncbi:MAG: tetratricopeptide repeat protein [Propionivibrio sp.]
MKSIRRTFCITAAALAVALTLPARAEDVNLSARKAPAARQANPPSQAPNVAPTAETQGELSAGQTVFQVLLAEIALQRGDLELASQAYANLSLRTRDPQVMERTIEVAGYARRFDLARETARLWLDVDPASKRAQRMLVSMLILSNQLEELPPHLIAMLESDRGALAENLLGLNRMFARSTDRLAVFRLIDKVCQPFFGIAEAHYAVAVAASSAGQGERAKHEIQRALELRPDWEMAAFLQAQLLLRESPAEAIVFLEGFLQRNPNAREAELLLARALVGERRYADAKRHFDQLLQAYPDSPEVVYAVAILALQQDDKTLAETQLKHFVSLKGTEKSPAYYYLGQIAEEGRRNDEALAYYSQVVSGEHYLPAQMRRARILAQQGQLDRGRDVLRNARAEDAEQRVQLYVAEAALLREAKRPEEAFDLLESRLAEQPEQPDLMYETALMAERLNKLELMEVRLRRLIELRPDNPQAYNALGYAYADRNERLTEARQLIEKALALAPDDGFILDSMGWVLFRQGDLPGALAYLERSYAKREDPEIAAHLGEVLWAMGRQDDARRLLLDAQKNHPTNEVLAETIRKLVP